MSRRISRPELRIEAVFGYADGLRWGTAHAKAVPTHTGHFHWTYDALTERARIFYLDKASERGLVEFVNAQLSTALAAIVSHRMAEGRAA